MEQIYRVYEPDGRLKTRGTASKLAHRYGVDKSLIGMCAKEHRKLRNIYTVTQEVSNED